MGCMYVRPSLSQCVRTYSEPRRRRGRAVPSISSLPRSSQQYCSRRRLWIQTLPHDYLPAYGQNDEDTAREICSCLGTNNKVGTHAFRVLRLGGRLVRRPSLSAAHVLRAGLAALLMSPRPRRGLPSFLASSSSSLCAWVWYGSARMVARPLTSRCNKISKKPPTTPLPLFS